MRAGVIRVVRSRIRRVQARSVDGIVQSREDRVHRRRRSARMGSVQRCGRRLHREQRRRRRPNTRSRGPALDWHQGWTPARWVATEKQTPAGLLCKLCSIRLLVPWTLRSASLECMRRGRRQPHGRILATLAVAVTGCGGQSRIARCARPPHGGTSSKLALALESSPTTTALQEVSNAAACVATPLAWYRDSQRSDLGVLCPVACKQSTTAGTKLVRLCEGT